jgi:hypothetical protein
MDGALANEGRTHMLNRSGDDDLGSTGIFVAAPRVT